MASADSIKLDRIANNLLYLAPSTQKDQVWGVFARKTLEPNTAVAFYNGTTITLPNDEAKKTAILGKIPTADVTHLIFLPKLSRRDKIIVNGSPHELASLGYIGKPRCFGSFIVDPKIHSLDLSWDQQTTSRNNTNPSYNTKLVPIVLSKSPCKPPPKTTGVYSAVLVFTTERILPGTELILNHGDEARAYAETHKEVYGLGGFSHSVFTETNPPVVKTPNKQPRSFSSKIRDNPNNINRVLEDYELFHDATSDIIKNSVNRIQELSIKFFKTKNAHLLKNDILGFNVAAWREILKTNWNFNFQNSFPLETLTEIFVYNMKKPLPKNDNDNGDEADDSASISGSDSMDDAFQNNVTSFKILPGLRTTNPLEAGDFKKWLPIIQETISDTNRATAIKPSVHVDENGFSYHFGNGVFATKHLKKGSIIAYFCGEILQPGLSNSDTNHIKNIRAASYAVSIGSGAKELLVNPLVQPPLFLGIAGSGHLVNTWSYNSHPRVIPKEHVNVKLGNDNQSNFDHIFVLKSEGETVQQKIFGFFPMRATSDISPGQELIADYGDAWWKGKSKNMHFQSLISTDEANRLTEGKYLEKYTEVASKLSARVENLRRDELARLTSEPKTSFQVMLKRRNMQNQALTIAMLLGLKVQGGTRLPMLENARKTSGIDDYDSEYKTKIENRRRINQAPFDEPVVLDVRMHTSSSSTTAARKSPAFAYLLSVSFWPSTAIDPIEKSLYPEDETMVLVFGNYLEMRKEVHDLANSHMPDSWSHVAGHFPLGTHLDFQVLQLTDGKTQSSDYAAYACSQTEYEDRDSWTDSTTTKLKTVRWYNPSSSGPNNVDIHGSFESPFDKNERLVLKSEFKNKSEAKGLVANIFEVEVFNNNNITSQSNSPAKQRYYVKESLYVEHAEGAFKAVKPVNNDHFVYCVFLLRGLHLYSPCFMKIYALRKIEDISEINRYPRFQYARSKDDPENSMPRHVIFMEHGGMDLKKISKLPLEKLRKYNFQVKDYEKLALQFYHGLCLVESFGSMIHEDIKLENFAIHLGSDSEPASRGTVRLYLNSHEYFELEDTFKFNFIDYDSFKFHLTSRSPQFNSDEHGNTSKSWLHGNNTKGCVEILNLLMKLIPMDKRNKIRPGLKIPSSSNSPPQDLIFFATKNSYFCETYLKFKTSSGFF